MPPMIESGIRYLEQATISIVQVTQNENFQKKIQKNIFFAEFF